MQWIKTGWGESFDSNRENFTDSFFVDLRSKKTSTLDIVSVAKNAINNIVQVYPPPYYLFASGGIDSQAMIWLWKYSGVPFFVTSIEYTSENSQEIFNQHDLEKLKKFSYIHDITVNYEKFDLISFLEKELANYALKYQCTSPQICTHMKMSEIYKKGTIIFSGNFKQHMQYTYTIWGLKRYADTSGRNVIPFFLLHDKELACYIDDYSRKKYDVTANNAVNYQYLQRASSMQAAGIPVLPQIEKFTGFEKVKDYYDAKPSSISLMEKLEFSKYPSKRTFDIMFRYRLYKLINYNDVVTYIRD